MSGFEEFQKIARLRRGCVITEKIDGTNAQVEIISKIEPAWAERVGLPVVADFEDCWILAGSRSRYITPAADNFGFAAWVKAHAEELRALGPGRHYGEWWGSGVNRGYGLVNGEKRFSLFNTARWGELRDREKFGTDRPACCGVVPVLYRGPFLTHAVDLALSELLSGGSKAAPGFMKPEGVVIYHEAARQLFKVTLEKDDEPKSKAAVA